MQKVYIKAEATRSDEVVVKQISRQVQVLQIFYAPPINFYKKKRTYIVINFLFIHT